MLEGVGAGAAALGHILSPVVEDGLLPLRIDEERLVRGRAHGGVGV